MGERGEVEQGPRPALLLQQLDHVCQPRVVGAEAAGFEGGQQGAARDHLHLRTRGDETLRPARPSACALGPMHAMLHPFSGSKIHTRTKKML